MALARPHGRNAHGVTMHAANPVNITKAGRTAQVGYGECHAAAPSSGPLRLGRNSGTCPCAKKCWEVPLALSVLGARQSIGQSKRQVTVPRRDDLDLQPCNLPADGSAGVEFHAAAGEPASITGIRAGPPRVACSQPVVVHELSDWRRQSLTHGIDS
jgi:hypothetical protein